MKKIGITGGIGSGKSLISKVFESLGVPVFYADTVAKELVKTNQGVRDEIKFQFGSSIFVDNDLDRRRLAEIVFGDDTYLQKLNAIIHPAVGLKFEEFCNRNSKLTYILKEAAILFETGLNKELDKVIVVDAPEAIRINRVVKRDNTNIKDVKSRISKQWSSEDKVKLADFVIDNSGNKLVIPQVIKIHDKILAS